ncbi:hypothetical protein PHLGIDRAFT_79700 [Phlebiopsis gigantea 11061_1 CR5-6]|uniref:HAT C-terminal dimerisation domain-containing protein n=1 Tax=Phlebiopsis gigantea (strain 11061_1 CR5-6) TaxID=745531 RepID=A0A0C3NC14_PHLG1|nr:hypothetical protein PHLGIDRAFT_79700 [Phlebiopsis gigantea 11061_1 CR5-6]
MYIYSALVVLHLCYKLEYFRRQKWPADWIDEVKRLLRKYRDAHHKLTNAMSALTPSGPASATTSVNDLFADIDFFNVSDSPDPITEYLDTALLGHVVDPIQFWNSQLARGHPLASMALNFLSVPASSVDVERAFSRGGLTVLKCRHALSDESVRAATILGSWASVKGLIPEADILEVFRNKSKRTKKVEGGLYMDEDDATTPEVINIV